MGISGKEEKEFLPVVRQKRFAWIVSTILLAGYLSTASALTLYVDPETNQVYTTPGENRIKLGDFEPVKKAENMPAGKKPTEEEARVLETRIDQKMEELKAMEARFEAQQQAIQTASEQTQSVPVPDSTPENEKSASKEEKKWYDRIKIGGYTQFRQSAGLGGDLENLSSPGDKSIEEDTNFFIRRARLVFQGDISDHLKLYMQTEFAGGDVSVRDMYGDIYFDKKQEFRIRPGLSKVPNSFELLQSSRDRLAFERADALSTGVRNERDTGVFFYWTPEHIQERFSFLRKGLKGSGDYGVIGFGLYTGQGINERDKNDNLHIAARVTYPFQFDNGQIFETGVYGYTGKFVPDVAVNTDAGILAAPIFNKKGYRDARIGLHAILYPQPFGLQAEWNWGKSPQLSADMTRIESGNIDGGYVQAMYKYDSPWGALIPYVKWQKYSGAEKFQANAPFARVREIEAGLEWQIRPEVEFVVAYSHMDRTNVKNLVHVKDANIMRFQLQWNY
ncbi:Phosphate-selective porin [Nitrosomonas aestuarii]|uniref:Phosphate-selective porin n=1 Tax=Nitrosomonas aestuarii TaxID=52441 RepID=A0A1I3Y479_9PROT|nr:porin [Nitrosomonas aestuarii]SFK26757.1 Phosphate-selective porin [Nitrosomonas aestuarii]